MAMAHRFTLVCIAVAQRRLAVRRCTIIIGHAYAGIARAALVLHKHQAAPMVDVQTSSFPWCPRREGGWVGMKQ